MLNVRPYTPDDAPAVLALVNQARNLPFGREQFLQADARRDPTGFFHRVVADQDGSVVGVATLELVPPPFGRPGWLSYSLIVDREHWGRGIARALESFLAPVVAERATAGIDTEVRDTDPESRAWAERRGLSLNAHRFESVLELSTFDPAPHRPALERAQDTGLRFVTMADVPGEDGERRMYDFFVRSLGNDPTNPQGPPPSFEVFRDRVMADPFMPPEGIVIAVDGERFVGVSVPVWLGEAREDLHTRFTGVNPEYQGRGLALALKLLTIEYAVRAGARRMRTSNDSRNEPILAVNRRLGYAPLPGVWRLERKTERSVQQPAPLS